MTPLDIGFLSLALMLGLIWLGFHVAVVLTGLSFLGVWLIRDNVEIAGRLLAISAYESIASHYFAVVPLFVLMGLTVGAADVGRDTYRVAERLFRGLRGGLGVATVAANTVFAAITGISIASAAVFTKVAVPEMTALGYTPRFATGVVAGSSVLGMLIPPSLLLIVYAFLAEQSIGAMFVAGIVPGLILALAMSAGIVALAWLRPGLVGGAGGSARESERAGADDMGVLRMLLLLAPAASIITAVLGGIYAGWFTPTEAAAVGALLALVIALGRRKLTWPRFWALLKETGYITVSVCFLLIAASIYTRMLAMSGVPQFLIGTLGDMQLGLAGFLVLYFALLVVMGTILDSTSILLISVPLMLPVALGFGLDPVWFGIVTVIAIEVGLLTPPLGLSVYVIKSTLDDDRIGLADIFIGAAPFVVIMLLVLCLLSVFPTLVVY